MKKNIAMTPPMGWNSWDCYGASVTEDEVRGNADYMAKHLKAYGWEYIIVDIQWYEPKATTSAYNNFFPLEMDEYSRLIPAVNRFPSSEGGKGFKPLADYIHSLGLKFGIHIMRGIPRQAVHRNTPILGTDIHARDIAHPNSICKWNTDMYGIDSRKEGAAEYYNSIIELYTSWEIDYIKVDDMASPYSEGEIELIRKAIDHCGRDIVLSLSPGPAPIEKAEHLKQHANMWRMTDDFWDFWDHIVYEFDRCNLWSSHVGPGHWPDADMLTLGHIGIRSCQHGLGDRWTLFTKDEQVTMMTLWCIFRSPLMLGSEMRDNDEWTLSLLTNEEVLRVLNHSHSAHQLYRTGENGEQIAWTSLDEDGSIYVALFNASEAILEMEAQFSELGISGTFTLKDLWSHEHLPDTTNAVRAKVPSHGARFFKLTSKK